METITFVSELSGYWSDIKKMLKQRNITQIFIGGGSQKLKY
jgi:hypothetical protein